MAAKSRRQPGLGHRLSRGCTMSRSMSSFVAATLIAAALALPNHARADGSDFAAGIFGGLIAGAIVGSAVAPRGPGPEPVYVAPSLIIRSRYASAAGRSTTPTTGSIGGSGCRCLAISALQNRLISPR
jgi:hypothetical protein